MKLNYTFKHLDSSVALQEHTQTRLDEVGRFLLKDGFGQVVYSKHNHEFTVEISLNTHERYFRATAYSNDPYQAVDECCLKLEKQFLKTRKLMQDHKKHWLSKEGRLNRVNSRMEHSFRYKKAA